MKFYITREWMKEKEKEYTLEEFVEDFGMILMTTQTRAVTHEGLEYITKEVVEAYLRDYKKSDEIHEVLTEYDSWECFLVDGDYNTTLINSFDQIVDVFFPMLTDETVEGVIVDTVSPFSRFIVYRENGDTDITQDLPKLEGSDKQVRWADSLRTRFLKNLKNLSDCVDRSIIHIPPHASKDYIDILYTMKVRVSKTVWCISEVTSAKWFIDSRVDFFTCRVGCGYGAGLVEPYDKKLTRFVEYYEKMKRGLYK